MPRIGGLRTECRQGTVVVRQAVLQACVELEEILRGQAFENDKRCFAEVLREGLATKELRMEDPLETAYCLILATNGLMPFSLINEMMAAPEIVENRLHTVVKLLLAGLQAE